MRIDRSFATATVVCLAFTSASALAQQSTGAGVQRWYNPAMVERGRKLFAQHCAACHGDRAQGATNWRERDADNKMPPPPLNGTGHGWHHPAMALLSVIANGSPGGGNMPAWREALSREEMVATIAWFQSQWSDDIYSSWIDIEQRSRQ